MKAFLWILSLILFAIYFIIVAVEDYKTMKVTRWKHMLGFASAMLCLCVGMGKLSMSDYIFILLFVILFMAFGFMKIYGLADGFVLANLTILFGGIGGIIGIGAVVIIMALAAFSMLICHVVKSVANKKGLFQNYATAFVPHLLVGYGVLWAVVIY